MDFQLENYPRWLQMVQIAKDVIGEKTADEIATILGKYRTDNILREVLTYIEKKGLCEVRVEKSRKFHYTIHNKELAKFLREGLPFKYAEDIIELTMSGIARY